MKTLLICSLVSAVTVLVSSESFKATTVKAPFVEQFDSAWESRWKSSAAVKKTPEGFEAGENDNVEDLFRYRGEWSVEEAAKNALDGDRGLVAKTAAAHHAISVSFEKPVNPEGKDLVIQYDLKFQEELQCGGAYIKLLTESKEGIKYQEFSDSTPYTIMFGPDRCGTTNKVHFIFRHQNPITKKWEEKHLTNPPAPRTDLNTHSYTLHVQPDNTFHILIDGERVKSGSLLEDFDPAVNPPAEIPNPDESKPADWVEEPKIADPSAVKPADWDEDAPRMIEDEEAAMPENWLEDEPEFIDDPAAERPEDWDEEEDGKWVAPQVPNPACETVSGCGKWTRPMMPNPEYKGKWYPPLIDNPDYKGPWEASKIPNPDYFEDKTPSKFTKLSGIGIELWTMQAGIMFDNFYVGHSIADAQKLADETFALKKKLDTAAEEQVKKENEERIQDQEEISINKLSDVKDLLVDFATAFVGNPGDTVKKSPKLSMLIALLFLAPSLLYVISGFFRNTEKNIKEKVYAKGKKTDAVAADVKDGEDEVDADDEKETDGLKPRRRKPKTDE
eukprot:Partr_v1_DN25634_c0_g1_i1_m4429 putative Calnexin